MFKLAILILYPQKSSVTHYDLLSLYNFYFISIIPLLEWSLRSKYGGSPLLSSNFQFYFFIYEYSIIFYAKYEQLK